MYLINDVHNLFYAKISEVTYREHSGIRCDIHICGKNSQHLIDRQLKGSALFSKAQVTWQEAFHFHAAPLTVNSHKLI